MENHNGKQVTILLFISLTKSNFDVLSQKFGNMAIMLNSIVLFIFHAKCQRYLGYIISQNPRYVSIILATNVTNWKKKQLDCGFEIRQTSKNNANYNMKSHTHIQKFDNCLTVCKIVEQKIALKKFQTEKTEEKKNPNNCSSSFKWANIKQILTNASTYNSKQLFSCSRS